MDKEQPCKPCSRVVAHDAGGTFGWEVALYPELQHCVQVSEFQEMRVCLVFGVVSNGSG
jgi:hypothetical protein